MPLTFSAFYLGNPGIMIDPTERNNVAENASQLVGTSYGTAENSITDNIVSFTSDDRGGVANALDMDNRSSNDRAIINDGSGNVTYTFDATSVYSATITYSNGTTVSGIELVVVQMTNGDLYAVPSPISGTPTNTALTALPIRSITLNSLIGNTYTGMASDRPALTFPVCFTRGTRIATARGLVRIETLTAGDMIWTADHGLQPVRWIGMRQFSATELQENPALRPIRIRAGALGPGLPQRDLTVSPQHRVLVQSRIAARMFGVAEVMTAAKHLLEISGIDQLDGQECVEYWHFLLNRHEIVLSEGARTESLFTGPEALRAVGAAARDEILTIFPHLAAGNAGALPDPARLLLDGRQGRQLAQRHARNGRPLAA